MTISRTLNKRFFVVFRDAIHLKEGFGNIIIIAGAKDRGFDYFSGFFYSQRNIVQLFCYGMKDGICIMVMITKEER